MVIHRRIMLVVFLMMLVSPLFGWLSGIRVDLEEKRNPAKMPRVSFGTLLDQSFFKDFEQFFNDHFAYRVLLIKLKNGIDYYTFNTSPSPEVHIGTNGWFYYRITLRDYLKVDDCRPGEKERMRQIARQIAHLERLIEDSGRRFVFVVAPDKSTIYPEHIGFARPASRCHKSRYDLFLDALGKFPVKNFVRLDRLLVSAKKEQQVYYKTDTHWNMYGSRLAGEAILRHIVPEGWEGYYPKVRMATKSYTGDLSNMMSLNLSEQTALIDKADYPSDIQETSLGQFLNGDRFRYVARPLSGKRLLPRTIVYRDSFVTGTIPYLKGSFEQLDLIWSNNITTDLRPDPVEDLQSSKIVIFEIVERLLPGLWIDLPAWKRALSDNASTGTGARSN
jgi:hypothetical protein